LFFVKVKLCKNLHTILFRGFIFPKNTRDLFFVTLKRGVVMVSNILRYLKLPIILLLVLSLLPLVPNQSFAKKRKKSKKVTVKKSVVRKQAIETIMASSEQVSSLAGLQSMVTDEPSVGNNDTNGEVLLEGEDLEELAREDDVTVDLEMFKSLWLSYVSDGDNEEQTESGVKKSSIMGEIMDWLGTRYHFGGLSQQGVDCSGFVLNIYYNSASIILPRTARSQYEVGSRIGRKGLEFGDLVFFNTRRRPFVSHVGIYLGDNLFAHSSSRYGVTVSSLESQYYGGRFIGGRRLSVHDLARLSANKNSNLESQ
jgi:cell wall-associated NlpC family hydrolase